MNLAEHSEVELKLAVDPDDVERLEPHPLLRHASKPRRLVSTYFDTADHRLRKAGLSLRIRTDGGRNVQTVKLANGAAAGLFARGEWEREVAASTLDLTASRTRRSSPCWTARASRRCSRCSPSTSHAPSA
jgi:inorganic triphosphatase YgiF